jgi:integrase
LDPGGAAAGWRPATQRNVAQGWGHFLAWLARTGQLDAGESLPERLTPERLAGFTEVLRARGNTARTVHMRVEALGLFLAAAVPGADRGPVERGLRRLRAAVEVEAAGRRHGKRARLQSSHDLLALGLRLMAEADAGELSARRRAVRHRDGLIVALLAARPLRRRNFVALELGRHLVRAGGSWRLVILGAETKTGRSLDLPFPTVLVPALERYLTAHRPVLAAGLGRGQGRAGAALWLSAEGGPLSEVMLGFLVKARTRAAFGRPVNPHLFRDAAATSVAIEDPARVRIAAQVLGHGTFSTTERHYNLARGQEAAESWHATLDGLRLAGKGRRGA